MFGLSVIFWGVILPLVARICRDCCGPRFLNKQYNGSKSSSTPKVTQDKDVFGFLAPKLVRNHSASGSSLSFAPHMSSVLGAGPCPSFL